MLKKTIFITALILALVSAGLFYINKVLLPVQVKDMVLRALKDQLKREASFDRLYFNPLKGFVITDLKVQSKDKPEEIFVHIKEASAQILALPLLQKKIIITSLHIDSPAVRLVRFEANTWNFSDLIQPPPTPTAQTSTTGKQTEDKPLFDIIISGFSLADGRLRITDLAGQDEFNEMIEPINLQGSLALNSTISLSGTIGLPATKGVLDFNGHYLVKNASFRGGLNIKNLVLNRYQRLAPPLPLSVRELTITSAAITSLWSAGKLDLEGSADLPSIDFDPVPGTTLKTALALRKVLLSVTSDGAITLKGSIKTSKTLLTSTPGVSFAGALSASVHKFQFAKNTLAFDGMAAADIDGLSLSPEQSLSGEIRLGQTSFTLNGSEITAASEIETRNLSIQLNATQTLLADIRIPDIKITPSPKGLTARGNLRILNAILTPGENQKITGNLSANNISVIQSGNDFQAEGDLDLKDLTASLAAGTLQAGITVPGAFFSLKEGVTSLRGRLLFKNTRLDLPVGITVTGDPTITATLVNDPKATTPLAYSGSISVEHAHLTGAPSVNEISDISSAIDFETDKASIKSLTLKVLDTPASFSGEIRQFAAPAIRIKAAIPQVDLALAAKILPDLFKEQSLTVSGQAALNASIDGTLANLASAKIQAAATLTDAAVASSKLNQKMDKISGTLTYNSPLLVIKDLSAAYQGQVYVINGSLNDFNEPLLNGSIKTDNFLAEIQAKKKNNDIRIERCSGTYLESAFDLKGLVLIPPGQAPSVDLTSEIKLALRDLPKMLPAAQAEQLKPLQLAGILKIKTAIQGASSDWTQYHSTVSIETPALSVMGFELENLVVKAAQNKGHIEPLTVEGRFYNGPLTIDAGIYADQKDLPFTVVFKLDRTDLALLKKATALSQKQISGFLSVDGKLAGTATQWKNMTGKAGVTVAEGYLWEFDLLSNVLKILSTTFQGGDIIITDASANLNFADQRITTDDLTLKSRTVSILGKGWVDWDQNINMAITPKLEPITGEGGIVNPLAELNPTDGLININVTGTVQKPIIKHNISAPTLIKKTLQNTVGGLLKIFE